MNNYNTGGTNAPGGPQTQPPHADDPNPTRYFPPQDTPQGQTEPQPQPQPQPQAGAPPALGVFA